MGKENGIHYPLVLIKSFKESEILVTENDFREQSSPETIQLSLYPDGKTVEDYLKPETLVKYKAALDEQGISYEYVKNIKAWVVSFQIEYAH